MKYLILPLLPLTLAACQATTGPARVLYPVEVCGYVDEPIYGYIDRPASQEEIIAGSVLGGAIGNQFGDGDGRVAMTVIGALVGGNIAAGQRQTEPAIVGYNKVHQCRIEYK